MENNVNKSRNKTKQTKKEKRKGKEIQKSKVNNINVINAVKENYKSFLCFAIAIYLISPENVLWGISSFIIISFLCYYSHYLFHTRTNIFTIIHKYHHDNDNMLSYYLQILYEISGGGIFLFLHYFFNINIVNYWIGLFCVLAYASVHNYNYSILKVNKVHKLHHEYIKINYGPDLLDIIFETKHPSEINVENTDHYINNIILFTLVVLLIKKYITINILIILFEILFLFLFIISIMLWLDFRREHNKKWYDGII